MNIGRLTDTLKNRKATLLFFGFLVIFILIALKGLVALQPGDENVYYYMAKLISEGKIPYKDFFYAHPPLHIYLLALIYSTFGFNIVAMKLTPLISTLISAFFVFKIAKEKFGSAEAVISSLLFLFSYSMMFNSVFSFGIDVAAMFLVIGAYFLLNKNNHYLSGLFFGFAGITRLLSLVPISVIFAIVLLRSKKNFLKLSSAFLVVLLLVNGVFIMLSSGDYLAQAYKYHLLKSFGNKENFKEYTDIIKLNWILFSSALLFIFVKEKKPISVFTIVLVAYLIFLMTLNKIFGFYFIIAFPFLAVIGGYSIAHIFKDYFAKNIVIKKIFLTALLAVFAWNLASDSLFLQTIGFTGFERGKDLENFVILNSNKDTLLFGDDSVVPLLALLTNKKIALDFVDTNNEVFISGMRNLGNVLADLKGKEVIFIIRSKQGISYFGEVKNFLNRNCEFLSQFHDKIEGDYIVYKCYK